MAVAEQTARVLTVLNLKGGVGKTHTCWLLNRLQWSAAATFVVTVPPKPSRPVPDAQATKVSIANENQIALNALLEHLEEMATGVPQPTRRKMSMSTKPDPVVIRSRVLGFLKHPS